MPSPYLLSQAIKDGAKGYILGTHDKVTGVLSTANNPVVQNTKAIATTEAKRLLTSGAVSAGKVVVVMKVESYISLPEPTPKFIEV